MSICAGAYAIVFSQCVSVLATRRDAKWHPRAYLMWTTIVLFVLATLHLGVDIDRNLDAQTSDVWTPEGAEKYYQNLGTWKNVLKSVCYVTTTVISDAFIVYRCYIVWQMNHAVVYVPAALFLADIAVGIWWCYTLSTVGPGQDFHTAHLSRLVTSFYAITLGLTSICTALIAYRIRKIQMCVASYCPTDSRLTQVVALVVESGAIYSACLVVMIVTYSSESPAMFIFLNLFSAVIVRVGRGVSHGDRFSDTSSPRGAPEDGVQISLEQTIRRDYDHSDFEPPSRPEYLGDAKISADV
ncbi:hypothetical protein PLICRDRAFT_684125 [Plicaturopsis crispa FD-325 SS-3]|nr:hypothetical protein PLICRDRAFT_684125 [Plicaturopsis crispa FD-325 SS-3]